MSFNLPHWIHALSEKYTLLLTVRQTEYFLNSWNFWAEWCRCLNKGSSKVKVLHWVCCLESHQNGEKHYHCSVKLSGSKCWKAVKDTLKKESSIQVHFWDAHDNHWSAFKYITKSDPNIFLSSNHPNMQEMSSPKTKVCVQANRRKGKSRSTETSGDQVSTATKPPKIARLTNLEEFISRNKISNEDELFAITHTQKEEDKKDLANFLLWHSQK